MKNEEDVFFGLVSIYFGGGNKLLFRNFSRLWLDLSLFSFRINRS